MWTITYCMCFLYRYISWCVILVFSVSVKPISLSFFSPPKRTICPMNMASPCCDLRSHSNTHHHIDNQLHPTRSHLNSSFTLFIPGRVVRASFSFRISAWPSSLVADREFYKPPHLAGGGQPASSFFPVSSFRLSNAVQVWKHVLFHVKPASPFHLAAPLASQPQALLLCPPHGHRGQLPRGSESE